MKKDELKNENWNRFLSDYFKHNVNKKKKKNLILFLLNNKKEKLICYLKVEIIFQIKKEKKKATKLLKKI